MTVFGYKVQNRKTGTFKTAGNMWGMSKVGKLWPLGHFKSMLRSAVPYHYRTRDKSFKERLDGMHNVEQYDVVLYELKEVSRVPLVEWVEKEMKK